MKQTINGTFVMRGYYGLQEHTTEQSLADMLRTSFPDGSVVELAITVTLIDTWPKCREQTKYGVCGVVLDREGNCRSASQHVMPESDTEATEA